MSAVAERPLIEGKTVRIKEIAVVPYRDQPIAKTPRRWFRVVVGKDWGIVQTGGLLRPGVFLCTRHHEPDCECVTALIRSTLMENESPFAANGRG